MDETFFINTNPSVFTKRHIYSLIDKLYHGAGIDIHSAQSEKEIVYAIDGSRKTALVPLNGEFTSIVTETGYLLRGRKEDDEGDVPMDIAIEYQPLCEDIIAVFCTIHAGQIPNIGPVKTVIEDFYQGKPFQMREKKE